MSIDFTFNVAQLLSPVLLVVLAYLVNTARKAVERHNDERHAETSAHVDERYEETKTMLAEHRTELMGEVKTIRDLAANTNGKVAEHDKQITSVTAKQEVLLEMMLGRQPDKGM